MVKEKSFYRLGFKTVLKRISIGVSLGRRIRMNALACAVMLAAGAASAEEFDIESAAVTLFDSFSKIQQQHDTLAMEPERVLDVQNYLIALMRPHWGMDVGYLADLGSDSQQPPTGILLENMFTGTRAVVSRSFGIDMRAAGELMFRVGSDDINEAQTREEVIASLHSVIPSVRMTDRLLAAEDQDSVARHTAANLQIRMYVLGQEYEFSGEDDLIERLPEIRIVLLDQNKETLATSGPVADRQHPIDSILHMCHALNARGIRIEVGNVLGIGSWTDSYPVAELTRLAAVFNGLDQDRPVQVYMGFR